MPDLKPVLLQREIHDKSWGGTTLARWLGVDAPSIGETWELLQRGQRSTAFAGGGCLGDWMRTHRRELLGRGVAPGFGETFPLLIKFLDASKRLSVQVHPDDAQAAPLNDGGKSEAWVVLDALPGGTIYRGFRPGVTAAQLQAAAGTPAIEPLLHSFAPRRGDCIDVRANTVHAVGHGVLLYEVQQNSDITWRLWDWGSDRPLQVEEALRVARVTPGEPATVAPQALRDGGELLVQTSWFRIRRYRLEDKRDFATHGVFQVVTAVDGAALVGWHSGGNDDVLHLPRGCSVLVPASTERVFLTPAPRCELLVVDPGQP